MKLANYEQFLEYLEKQIDEIKNISNKLERERFIKRYSLIIKSFYELTNNSLLNIDNYVENIAKELIFSNELEKTMFIFLLKESLVIIREVISHEKIKEELIKRFNYSCEKIENITKEWEIDYGTSN